MLLIILSMMFSIFLTWFIGLLPVISIRYILIRRPLSKKSSKLLVCVFWAINLLIFSALGTKSRTHIALYVVGLVSYFIYRTDRSMKVLLSDIFFVICFWKSLNHLSLFLWLRYLRKKKIVLLGITAVTLSCALLIVVSSLFNGFISAFERSAVEAIGDIVIYPPVEVSGYSQLIERLEQSKLVEGATAALSSEGLVHLSKGNVRAVSVWGIEPERHNRVTGFKQSLIRQKSSESKVSFEYGGVEKGMGAIVGIGVVQKPDEKTDEYDFKAVRNIIGSDVVLTTGSVSFQNGDDNKTPEIRRRTVKFTVTDVIFTGVYDLDKNIIYLPIKRLQGLLYPDDKEPAADQIQIKLAGNVKDDAAMKEVSNIWASFAKEELGWSQLQIKQAVIVTSKQMQSKFVAEIRKQMGILLLIFGVVSSSVVVLIFCIFYMIVESRQRDVAVIKSFGGSGFSLAFVFVWLGGIVGIIGAGLGMLLAYIIVKNFNIIEGWLSAVFGFKLWKSSVYMFSRIPTDVDWHSAGMIAFFSILAAAAGALLPAIVAARSQPVDILRYE